ncbi:unnamed protein product [Rotaria magnacalcarata]|uniref:Retrotransposon gag domain-containing protein n=1 Tax=Rotaria magnacalcarata TaxID=392030 RepID=A0A8S2NXV3_9BILA|nr:unnamed protein product [Rotaria magnacalcarata]CAF4005861.1 unnamed protein product [Rotaria magnacalcarata]CAF4023604.1 unnamed protein product [Rotaria magnacalcarata]
MADERSIQFLTEFEIRASAFVGQNDTLFLHFVQQALSGGALIWFDYFECLKNLIIEIGPNLNDHWLKYNFIQKLRSDIRSRLNLDINLSTREIVRMAQVIESSI